MIIPSRIPQLSFEVPKKEGVGEAWVLAYKIDEGFSLVITAEHGGDAEIFLTKAEFTQLLQRLAEVVV